MTAPARVLTGAASVDPLGPFIRTAFMSRLELTKECVYRRPVDIVRAHFLDFDHHIEHDVHRGLRYSVLERLGDRQRVRVEFRVLGLPKVDELLVYVAPDGSVVEEYVSGDFAGGTLRVEFEPRGPDATRVEARIDFPLRGFNRLARPLLRRVVSRLAEQAIEEDRVDLEERGYVPRSRSPGALEAAIDR